MSFYTKMDDLTQMVGPLTEDSIIKSLKSRFYSKTYQMNVGPDVICLNPFYSASNSKDGISTTVEDLIKNVLSQHHDTGHSQVFVLSGETGSGKTYQCKQIMDYICHGYCNKEVGDHLSAAMTVFNALASSSTLYNPHSTRMGIYLEAMTTDCVIYRSKIHCLFSDQRRLTNVSPDEQNFHIFYYMLSGLTSDERVKLHLEAYNLEDMRYLCKGLNVDVDIQRHQEKFNEWKKCLNILDIPVMDVLRILSTVLLLGNIEFQDGQDLDLEVNGQNELKSASALLGISAVALYRGLTTKSHNSDGQMCHTAITSNQATYNCATLARALYFRTVSSILRRVNNLKKTLQTSQSSIDSLQSQNSHTYNSRPDILSLSHGSNSLLHGRKFTDGFIGILDLLGFENYEINNLEKLCRNLCSEKIHHHFLKHTFITPLEILHDECIRPDVDVTYKNNSTIIDLIYSQPNGILPLLSRHSDISKVKLEQRTNNRFFEPLPKSATTFGIRHFAGRVNYDAVDFHEVNQDQLCDDVIAIFSKRSCNFGFASHLFSPELKQITSRGISGCKYRTMPSCHQDEISDIDNQGILTYDFPLRMDAILKSTSHAKPHYIHCIKSNDSFEEDLFDYETVLRQIHSLQLQETVQLMTEGLPHRMKYRAFNLKYKIFMLYRLSHKPDSLPEETREILECFLKRMDKSNQPYTTTQWIYGRKHIFYSESSRQCFDKMRLEIIIKSATVIQSYWRGYWARRSWTLRRKSKFLNRKRNSLQNSQKSFTKALVPSIVVVNDDIEEIPIYENHPADIIEESLLQYINKILSTHMNMLPKIPPNRSYTISNNRKMFFPQLRVFNEKFQVANTRYPVFEKGCKVIVTGVSPKPQFLIVQYSDTDYHVPYNLLNIMKQEKMVSGIL